MQNWTLLAAIIAGALAVDYWFMEPRGEFDFTWPTFVAEVSFAAVSGLMVGTVRALRRAEARGQSLQQYLAGELRRLAANLRWRRHPHARRPQNSRPRSLR